MKYTLTKRAKSAGCKFERPRDGDAGYDIYAARHVEIPPGYLAIIETGLSVAIPAGYVGMCWDRSSLGSRGIDATFVIDSPGGGKLRAGLIDSSYRGEIGVCLHNMSQQMFPVERGNRVCQMVIVRYLAEETEEVDKLPETVRGAGGFGSTGE